MRLEDLVYHSPLPSPKKAKRKISKLTIALLLTTLIVGTVLAASYWIYSNTVTHDVTEGAISLGVSSIGRTVTLIASGPAEGETVQFGQTTSSSEATDATFTFIGSATISSGVATLEWTAPSEGTYYFSARAYNTDFP